MSNPTFSAGSKVKILLDHNGKTHKNSRYGYIRAVCACKTAPDGFICTEKGFQREGDAYLIQTSWGGGMLWYSADALKLAGGINRLPEWKKKLEDYQLLHG
jgi:hypothetical protein